jgi:hypothetical protein
LGKLLSVVISLALFVSCAVNKVVPARLYDLSSADIIQAQFLFSGTTSGSISFALPSGERFAGEYQTLRGGSIGWGSVYGTVWGPSGAATVSGSGLTATMPTEYRGTAVMTSSQGTIITCEYISNTSRYEPHGQGACRDNRGKVYKLMY